MRRASQAAYELMMNWMAVSLTSIGILLQPQQLAQSQKALSAPLQ
jgi:hypothetical protein